MKKYYIILLHLIGYDCLSSELYTSRREAIARIREMKDDTPCLLSAEVLSVRVDL